MKYTLTLLLLIFSVHIYSIKNWLPYINNISRMEYGGGTQNWTITRDNTAGFMQPTTQGYYSLMVTHGICSAMA